jgi:DNA-directed RNA polymerase subunit RPC12/RpoP
MTTEPCDFERLCARVLWSWFPVKTGAKRRKVRCPRCGKRLRLRTVPDRQDGGVAFYCIPPHRTTVRRLAWQLRLPGVK